MLPFFLSNNCFNFGYKTPSISVIERGLYNRRVLFGLHDKGSFET